MPQGLPTVIPNQVIESAHINNIADRVVGRFASTAERDAAIPTPVNGMVCAVAGLLQVRTGGVWKLAAPVPVHMAVSASTSGSGDFTSATPTEAGPALTWPAPPAGATHIQGTFSPGYMLATGTAPAYCEFAIRVRTVPNGNNGDGLNPSYFSWLAGYGSTSFSFTSRWSLTNATGLRLLIARVSGTSALRVGGTADNMFTFEGFFV